MDGTLDLRADPAMAARPDPYNSPIWLAGHSWSYSDERPLSVLVGMRISFLKPGYLVGIRYLRHPANHGWFIGCVCETDGGNPVAWSMQKAPLELDTPETAQWHSLYLHRRFRPVVDTEYEIGVWFSQAYYAYEPLGTAVDYNDGEFLIPADNLVGRRNGVFSYHEPSGGFTDGFTHLYGVDVMYLTDVGA